ncbi:MAG: hypothetical protein ACRDUY_13750 [Nitriliruptorales bacterium]
MAGEVSKRATYHGPATPASMLVAMLEREGVRVEWEPPREARDMGAPEIIAIGLLLIGAEKVIDEVIARFRARFAGARVEVEDDDGE